jgi:hypothetical protein
VPKMSFELWLILIAWWQRNWKIAFI